MKISHNPDQQAFVIALGGAQAVLNYSLSPASIGNEGGVDFTRTYVPSEFRGQGYAEALVKYGLNWAAQQGLKVQSSCWYVRGFL
jgi:uncharacterized protein